MGLGSTAKKIQTVADTAEKLYARVNEMREQVDRLRDTVSTTEERVERVEAELAEQRALVAALAEEQGVDVESVLADAEAPAHPDDGERDDTADAASDDGGDGSTDAVDGSTA
ncbi:DUF5798 family protein [Halorarum salinum]|uniref:Uncharacterized protein n=1 Tax=Halorarum salinum TaxID=2743089 RepID=A0A7D5Q9W7_9EURY|nr:DUF5798 family protein [Halobaculum salinum]QLG62076.1 hypothetical protein HUG12_10190 [Halobaculum salinum]